MMAIHKDGSASLTNHGEKPNPRLKSPETISAAQLIDLCAKVIIGIPEMMDLHIGAIEQLTEQLSVIALYCQKKGLADGIFTAEDFEPVSGPPDEAKNGSH